jgi:hypothetical protein
MNYKTCGICKSSKPASDFNRNASNKDGLHTYCRECAAARLKAWRTANADRVKEYTGEWRSVNAARMKATKAAHHARNKEQLNAKSAAWRRENRERSRAACAAWFAKNPARRAALQQKRNAAKLRATPAWANEEAILSFYTSANALGMLTGEWYHVDHIVPLQGKLVCGLHVENNLRVISATENLSKGNRFFEEKSA